MFSVSIVLSYPIQGADATILELKRYEHYFIPIAILYSIFTIVGLSFCLYMIKDIEALSEYEGKCEDLIKEKEKYKQATTEFVKTFKIKTTNLL
jgi:Tfp pilus assembly protein PilO